MNDQERAEAKAELAQICYELGCSGTSPAYCPGDPDCQIIRKIFRLSSSGNVHATNILVDEPTQPKLFDTEAT